MRLAPHIVTFLRVFVGLAGADLVGLRAAAKHTVGGLNAEMKRWCCCYSGLEWASTRGPVAVLGELAADVHAMIRVGAQVLTWMTAAFCLLRGLPVLVEGWKYIAGNLGPARGTKSAAQEAM